ncbi:hypothetical protein ABLE91_26000 [Aquabacter sp. CN5-332]|uniref:hypothetical protein n=1 Tax=Aquabacter sp. CN5-332 TaxID=3156608 RepID=UPI0032B50DFA
MKASSRHDYRSYAPLFRGGGLSLLSKLGVLLAGVLVADPALAAQWSRPTESGGELTRSLTNAGNGVTTGSTTRTGPNGGSFTSSSTCSGGIVGGCSRSYSGVGANGKSFWGSRMSAYGPYGSRSVSGFTGPNGRTAYDFRRFRY